VLVDPADRRHDLPEVPQLHTDRRHDAVPRNPLIEIQHLVAMRDEICEHRASELAGTAGHDHFGHWFLRGER
jgi:hypothetical protein